MLKDEWTPALSVKVALISIRALLAAPVPEDPQDAQVAKQYLSNVDLFQETARKWTSAFATEGGGGVVDASSSSSSSASATTEVAVAAAPVPPHLRPLVDMGFSVDAAEAAYSAAGSVEAAIERLLSG